MDYEEIISKIKPELEKAIAGLREELLQIRSSRPSSAFLENIQVDCFGKKMPLKSLGLITSSGARDILVQPWDISYIEPIERAIFNSPLGLSCVNEKERIRVTFPPLSEELRKNFVRLLSEKGEETRKKVRHWREKAWRQIQDGFSEGEITEDDKYRGKDKLQDVIDEYNEKIEEMVETKKKDIME